MHRIFSSSVTLPLPIHLTSLSASNPFAEIRDVRI